MNRTVTGRDAKLNQIPPADCSVQWAQQDSNLQPWDYESEERAMVDYDGLP
jgi:hypothetical protein